MRSFPLIAGNSVTLNGSGNGTVSIGPTNAFQTWKPSNAACSVSSNSNEPVFVLYNGPSTDPATRIGGSYTGSNDNTDLSDIVLYPGTVLTGQWIGGDPGATATLSLTGTIEVPQ